MAEASTSGVENDNAGGIVAPYATHNLRVSKDNMFMILALWMEDLPVVATKFVNEDPCRKVGAVLVLPNDIVWAADCSRDGVHAVVRLLVKHRDKAKGCKMFMSRKPCRICAKLLVQSKVERVLYLPLEPEYYRSPEDHKPETEINTDSDPEKAAKSDTKNPESPDDIRKSNKTQMRQVDNLFIANPIAQTKFVLQVEKSVLKKAKEETPTEDERKEVPKFFTNELIKKYLDPEWLDAIEEELPWPAFDVNEVKKCFEEVMEWIARVIILSGRDEARGRYYKFDLSPLSKSPPNSPHRPYKYFDPRGKDSIHERQAQHFIEIARFLAQRTDDPTTGVGAVIVSYPKMEMISIGWNGFPLKAHYGEFARASDEDNAKDNKFSYVIHAEQNALMMRNNINIEGAIMFVTRSPCDECTPLIAMEGILTVVVDEDVEHKDPKEPKQDKALPALGYNVFPGIVKEGEFFCYQTKRCATDEKDIPASAEKSKDITAMIDESEK